MPGTLPQGETREFAIWNDIPTTLLGAAGTGCETMQGFDLFTPLTEGETSPRRCAIGTLFKCCALATKRWKLEYYFEEQTGRLFDRENDPQERTDLYESSDHRQVRNDLLHALLSWRGDIMDLKTHIDGTAGDSSARIHGHVKVAPRAAAWSRSMRGTEAEERLNQRAEAIDRESEG